MLLLSIIVFIFNIVEELNSVLTHKTSFMKKKQKDVIESCEHVITSTDDPEIRTGLAKYGYTNERFDEGKALLKSAKRFIHKQGVERSEMYVANENFFAKRDEFNQLYTDDIRLCRVVLTNSPDLIKIVPNLQPMYPYAKWQKNALTFYGNLNELPSALEILQKFNFTLDIIKSRISDLNLINELFLLRSKEKGESEMATQERNEAIDKLLDYCNEVRGIAKIVFGRKSQILEKMGILVRS